MEFRPANVTYSSYKRTDYTSNCLSNHNSQAGLVKLTVTYYSDLCRCIKSATCTAFNIQYSKLYAFFVRRGILWAGPKDSQSE